MCNWSKNARLPGAALDVPYKLSSTAVLSESDWQRPNILYHKLAVAGESLQDPAVLSSRQGGRLLPSCGWNNATLAHLLTEIAR